MENMKKLSSLYSPHHLFLHSLPTDCKNAHLSVHLFAFLELINSHFSYKYVTVALQPDLSSHAYSKCQALWLARSLHVLLLLKGKRLGFKIYSPKEGS